MTFNQVILLTNWQLFCGRAKFLRGRRKLPDVIFFLVASLVLSDAALDCHQYSQVVELARSLQFYKQCGIVKKVHIGFS